MTAMNNIEIMMPIKAVPYDHQKKAFAFAMKVFGVFREEGDSDEEGSRDLRSVREAFPEDQIGNP